MRRRIRIEDRELSYLADGSGPPLILMHTIGGSAYEYTRLIPLLRDRVTVYALDLPGHGESYALDPLGPVPDIALMLRHFIDALGAHHVSLLGNSMSGTDALEAGMRFPQSVDRIILVSGVGPWSDQPGIPPRPPTEVSGSERKDREWLRGQFSDPARADVPGLFDWWVRSRSVADDEMIRAWRRRPLPPYALADCEPPVLLITGERDPLHPRHWAEAWVRLMPRGRVATIPDARHFLNLERPEALAHLVAAFVTSDVSA